VCCKINILASYFGAQRWAVAVFVTAFNWLLRLTLAAIEVGVCAVRVAANTVWEGFVRVTALGNTTSLLP
jgi:hypothetical protein